MWWRTRWRRMDGWMDASWYHFRLICHTLNRQFLSLYSSITVNEANISFNIDQRLFFKKHTHYRLFDNKCSICLKWYDLWKWHEFLLRKLHRSLPHVSVIKKNVQFHFNCTVLRDTLVMRPHQWTDDNPPFDPCALKCHRGKEVWVHEATLYVQSDFHTNINKVLHNDDTMKI